MNKLHFMVLRSVGLVFLITLLFFVLLLVLIDLFGHLWIYIDKQVPASDILLIVIFYFPKCVSYSVPVALLFSISFTLGTLYANNELIGILGSGMSFFVLILPVIVAGLILSAGVFFFEENIVIPTMKTKTERQDAIVKPNPGASTTRDIGFIDRETLVLLKADAFIAQDNALVGLLVYDRAVPRVIYADRAQWDGTTWLLPSCWIYEYNAARTHLVGRREFQYRAGEIRQTPDKLKLTTDTIEEMNVASAAAWIDEMKTAGLPIRIAQTAFYNKYSYALRVFIVSIIAASIGGAFKKNILLMCLLFSLVLSVGFFVFQLITDAFAKNGVVPPSVGAFFPILVFFIIGSLLLARART